MIIQTTMMTMMILPIVEARIAEAPIAEVRAMTPVTPQIAETVRISDGQMKCCRRVIT